MNSKPDLPRRRAMRLRGYDYSHPGTYFVTACAQHRKCLFGTIIDGKMRLNEIGQIVVECWNRIPQHFPAVELSESVIMPNHFHGIISWGITEARDPQLPVGARSPRPPENINPRRGEVPSPITSNAPRRGEVPSSVGTNAPRRGEVSSPITSNAPRRGEVPSPITSNAIRRGEVSSPITSNAIRRGEVLSPITSNAPRRGEVPSPTLGKIMAYFKYQSTKHINQHHNTPGKRIWQRNYYDHIIRDDPDLQRLRQYIQNNPMEWLLDQLHPDNPSRW